MNNTLTGNSKPYRGFLVSAEIVDIEGVSHVRTRVNFPLLGLEDPPHTIFELLRPGPAEEQATLIAQGGLEARLTIDRMLNSECNFAVGHEPAPTVGPGAKRGVFTLTVNVNGQLHSHTWRTPTTFTFQDEAVEAATCLVEAYKETVGWPKEPAQSR